VCFGADIHMIMLVAECHEVRYKEGELFETKHRNRKAKRTRKQDCKSTVFTLQVHLAEKITHSTIKTTLKSVLLLNTY
jgi:hypothetical protein